MHQSEIDLQLEKLAIIRKTANMHKTTAENLDVDYGVLLPKAIADELFENLERNVEYYDGDLTKVRVFGKWYDIPRQQVAYGDDGLKYTFSGTTVPAKSWIPSITSIRNFVTNITGHQYNFVLINRYRNGNDHIGEHRDDESELDKHTPIASLTLGQKRVFVLKHRDARQPLPGRRSIPRVQIELEHGSLLLMNPPTNEFWYHSLPVRKSATGVRINLTFRKINV